MSRWLEAILPEPINLLGQRLNPFSLGHCILLNRLDNPFYVGGNTDLQDVLQGVFICSQTFDEAWTALADKNLDERIIKWQAQLGRIDIQEVTSVFSDYLKNGSFSPDLSDESESKRQPGTPFLLRLKLILQSKLGYTEKEALEKPFGAVLHEVLGLAELRGDVKVMNADELEMHEEHKKLRAEFATADLAVEHSEN